MVFCKLLTYKTFLSFFCLVRHRPRHRPSPSLRPWPTYSYIPRHILRPRLRIMMKQKRRNKHTCYLLYLVHRREDTCLHIMITRFRFRMGSNFIIGGGERSFIIYTESPLKVCSMRTRINIRGDSEFKWPSTNRHIVINSSIHGIGLL